MLIAARLMERMEAVGLSQAALARAVGVSQQAIGKLAKGSSRSTFALHRIAQALRTTPAYLEGEVDDPDEGAPAPPPDPTHHLVMLPVALPTERALTRMFLGLLLPFELESADLLARTLARQLPRGLRQLQGPLTESRHADPDLEDAAVRANDPPAPRRARRT